MTLNINYNSSQPNVIQNASNLLSSVVNQAIVRPLGAPNLTGISGLIMDLVDDEEVVIDSDITDHYVQENYAVQDHIALKPIRFTVRGYVGELVDDVPNALASIFTQVSGLTSLGGLAPQFNVQDTQFYAAVNNVVQLGTNVLNQVKNAFQLFNQSSTTRTRQQTVYQFFYNMWKTRQLCSVETPYAVFENMAIESIRALQSGESTTISEFTVTFKQIITVSSVLLSSNVGSLLSQNLGSISNLPFIGGGRFEQIISSPVNLGTDAGTANTPTGSSISVDSISQTIYKQQAALPNQY